MKQLLALLFGLFAFLLIVPSANAVDLDTDKHTICTDYDVGLYCPIFGVASDVPPDIGYLAPTFINQKPFYLALNTAKALKFLVFRRPRDGISH